MTEISEDAPATFSPEIKEPDFSNFYPKSEHSDAADASPTGPPVEEFKVGGLTKEELTERHGGEVALKGKLSEAATFAKELSDGDPEVQRILRGACGSDPTFLDKVINFKRRVDDLEEKFLEDEKLSRQMYPNSAASRIDSRRKVVDQCSREFKEMVLSGQMEWRGRNIGVPEDVQPWELE